MTGKQRKWMVAILVVLIGLPVGCTKVFSADVHNRLDTPINVQILFVEDSPQTGTIQAPALSVVKELVWADWPDEFKVVVTEIGGVTSSKTFGPSDLTQFTRGGSNFQIVTDESGTHLERASFWESNGDDLLLFGPCCAIFILIMGLLIRYEATKRKGPIIITRKM